MDGLAECAEVLAGPPPLGPGAAPLDRLDDGTDIDMLAVQLTAALDGPLLLYLSASDLTAASQAGERIARSWQDLVQRVCHP